jgi:thiamine pyrophosphokinase
VKAVIVANGSHVPSDRRELDDADVVIAADGGAAWLEEIGVLPSTIIGDLDSAGPGTLARMEAAGVRVARHPVDKDASDLELSLAHALAAGADEIVLLGILGGRLDHQVAGLLLLTPAASRGAEVRVVHGTTMARVLRGPGRIGIAAEPGSLVTLLPLDEVVEGVTTAGLRWALHAASLSAGSTRGLSNVITSREAWVDVAAGRLLVIEIGDAQGGGS